MSLASPQQHAGPVSLWNNWPPPDRCCREQLRRAETMGRLGLFELDCATRVLQVSPACQGLLRLPPEAVAHGNGAGDDGRVALDALLRAVHPRDRDRVRRLCDAAADHGATSQMGFELASDGGPAVHLVMHLDASCTMHGQAHRMAGLLQDVTAHKRSLQLQLDVERMTRHELRDPAAALHSLLEMLGADPTLPPGLRGLVHMAGESSQKLLETLDISTCMLAMETGCHQPESTVFDLAALLRDTAREVTRRHHVPVRFQWDHDSPLVARGGVLCLGAMLGNCLRNAAEASPPGAEVVVTTGSNDDMLTIAVYNQGSMSAETRERVFEKYYSQGKPGGLGLGAYMARLVARSHGGDVRCETSGPDAAGSPGGVTFTISLPRV